jgi:hypothetical protein
MQSDHRHSSVGYVASRRKTFICVGLRCLDQALVVPLAADIEGHLNLLAAYFHASNA